MEKTKAIVLLIAVSVLLVAVTAIAVTAFASAQPSNATSQTPQGTTSNTQVPQQGYYPYSGQYGYGRGMGMCTRFW